MATRTRCDECGRTRQCVVWETLAADGEYTTARACRECYGDLDAVAECAVTDEPTLRSYRAEVR